MVEHRFDISATKLWRSKYLHELATDWLIFIFLGYSVLGLSLTYRQLDEYKLFVAPIYVHLFLVYVFTPCLDEAHFAICVSISRLYISSWLMFFIGNLTSHPFDGLATTRCQAIIWTKTGFLFISPFETDFDEILFNCFHTKNVCKNVVCKTSFCPNVSVC